jgi:prepilin-type N-terminal cleavage/methylation domain-containing protein
MFKHHLNKRGFTLVEILVVVAIIAIMARIVTANLSGLRGQARDNRRLSDIKNIQIALSLYYSDNGMYPKNIYGTGASAPDSGLAPTYMGKVPFDPLTTGNPTCSTGPFSDPGCYRYNAYYVPGNVTGTCNSTVNIPTLYHIGSAFEDTTNSAVTTQDADIDGSGTTLAYGGTTYYRCTSPTGSFNGNAASCSGNSASTPDPCYDVMP